MLSEKIKLQYDLSSLQEHVRTNVLIRKPLMTTDFFGGWSVYSSNGSYQDGWAQGHLLYEKDFKPELTKEEKVALLGVKRSIHYVQETEICTGPLRELMNQIKGLNLNPRRARLSILKAHGASAVHRDGPNSDYLVRLHVPIITNEHCYFIADGEQEHFAADGESGYFIAVNRMHQVVNNGPTDRIHLIMDITDQSHITQFHRPF